MWLLLLLLLFYMTKPHTTSDDGFMLGLDKMFADFFGYLFLGEAHLQDSFVDRFSRYLSCQGSKLLHGGLEEM